MAVAGECPGPKKVPVVHCEVVELRSIGNPITGKCNVVGCTDDTENGIARLRDKWYMCLQACSRGVGSGRSQDPPLDSKAGVARCLTTPLAHGTSDELNSDLNLRIM